MTGCIAPETRQQSDPMESPQRRGDRIDRLLDLLLVSARCIPPRLALRLGAALGHWYGSWHGREQDRCRAHLARAFPEHDRAWVERTTRATFAHFGRMALWTLATRTVPVARLCRGVVVEGAACLRDLAASCRSGRGRVMMSGHFGNWELLARLGGRFLPITVIGRRLRHPRIDRLIDQQRRSGGASRRYQDDELRLFLRDLRQGRAVCCLPDQDIRRLAGVFVPWFGIPAYTPSGPALLALLSGCEVQPTFLYFHAGRWVMHFGPPKRFPRSRDLEAAATAIMTWSMAYEETLVRRHPEQWVWWHQRWRTTPEEVARDAAQRAGALPGPGGA